MMKRNWRRYLGQKPLPHLVMAPPTEVPVEYVAAAEGESRWFARLDDKAAVMEIPSTPSVWYVAAGIASFMAFVFWFGDGDLGFFGIAVSVLSFALAMFCAYVGVSAPEGRIVFDRENGVVTLPGSMPWHRDEVVPFVELYAAVGGAGYKGLQRALYAFRSDDVAGHLTIKGAPDSFGNGALLNDWSFWVWYMDKRRELPPSPALDRYRKPVQLELSEAEAKVQRILPPDARLLPGPVSPVVAELIREMEPVFKRYPELQWVRLVGIVHQPSRGGDALFFQVSASELSSNGARLTKLYEQLNKVLRKRGGGNQQVIVAEADEETFGQQVYSKAA